MRRLAGAAVAALSLAACGSPHPQGPAGTVVAKDSDQDCHMSGTGRHRHSSCHTEYELTVRDKAGNRHTFEVSSGDYGDCYRQSRYPKCTQR